MILIAVSSVLVICMYMHASAFYPAFLPSISSKITTLCTTCLQETSSTASVEEMVICITSQQNRECKHLVYTCV
jgi:hypothetical protein